MHKTRAHECHSSVVHNGQCPCTNTRLNSVVNPSRAYYSATEGTKWQPVLRQDESRKHQACMILFIRRPPRGCNARSAPVHRDKAYVRIKPGTRTFSFPVPTEVCAHYTAVREACGSAMPPTTHTHTQATPASHRCDLTCFSLYTCTVFSVGSSFFEDVLLLTLNTPKALSKEPQIPASLCSCQLSSGHQR